MRVPAGTIVVRVSDLLVRGERTVTAGNAVPSAGELAVFCRPVVTAPALPRRDGTVRAGEWLPDFVRLGELERHLGDGVIEAIVDAALEQGRLILIAGDVAGTGPVTGGAWLSDDGGRSWARVTVPAGHGAQDEFSNAAATADGFLLVRPARVNGLPAADVYRSPNGTTWTFAATLSASGGFTPGLMNSGPPGAVLAGQSGGTLTAFLSPDGASWHRAPAFGQAATEMISGVAVTGTGAVIAAGTSNVLSGGSQRLVTIAGGPGPGGGAGSDGAAAGSVRSVSLAAIPAVWISADGGRTWTESALPVPGGAAQVSALASGGGSFTMTGTFGVTPGERDVVVWTSPSGTAWTAATPAGLGLASPGIQEITGLAASGRTLTGVGFTATPAGEEPTLWRALVSP